MKRLFAMIILLGLLLCACNAGAEDAEPAASDSAPTEKMTQQASDPPKESLTEEPTAEQLAERRINEIFESRLSADSASVSVEAIEQYPELPTGCEAVALTIALNAFGCGLEKTEIAENYLEYNDNYAIGYCGDPFSDSGAGIWPPGLVKTVENYVNDTGKKIYARNTSGKPMEELYKCIDAGCPVVVWTTYYLCEPMYTDDAEFYDGETYPWYDNEHCVTMYGYDLDAGTVDIADPLQGCVTVDADEFGEINQAIGGFSMILLDISDL